MSAVHFHWELRQGAFDGDVVKPKGNEALPLVDPVAKPQLTLQHMLGYICESNSGHYATPLFYEIYKERNLRCIFLSAEYHDC